MATQKKRSKRTDDLRAEYDFRSLAGGVRGKYYRRAVARSNVVLLDPDVARIFSDDKAVNEALRTLMVVAAKRTPASRRLKVKHVPG